MLTFYAELHVEGHVFPLRRCSCERTQATNARGQVIQQVRQGLLRMEADVPANTLLANLASQPAHQVRARLRRLLPR